MWAGNVEIHVNSSDWYHHNHEKDKAYDNVILHVVWNDDAEIFRANGSLVPALELKEYVLPTTINSYNSLLYNKNNWINCEKDIKGIDEFLLNNWLERLYIERLERKSKEIYVLLESSKNNWEEVLFKLLLKNFGLKLNGESFLSLAKSFEYSIVRKLQSNRFSLEALFLGQTGLLDKDIQDHYLIQLKQQYSFLETKFNLSSLGVLPVQFFRLRPVNFPTIRLSQIAGLYSENKNLFSKLINATSIEDFYKIFDTSASEYWETHYTFGKISKKRRKKISTSFIDLLLINTVIPVLFAYSKFMGNSEEEKVIGLIQQISSECNGIIKKYAELNIISKSALDSQALIQLKAEYCSKNKCLQCTIGSALLNRNM